MIVYGFSSMLSRGRANPNWLKVAWEFLKTPRFNPLEMVNSNKGVVAFNLSYLFEQRALLQEAMSRMLSEVERGLLRPLPVTEFPLAEAGEAHRALQSGSTVGKLALIP
jgi:NADPH:quinone reductase-like Zn-dependent oxidoreductase